MEDLFEVFEYDACVEDDLKEQRGKVGSFIKFQMANKASWFQGKNGEEVIKAVDKRLEDFHSGRNAYKALWHDQKRDAILPPVGIDTELYADFLLLYPESKSLKPKSFEELAATLNCQGWYKSSQKGREYLARRLQHCVFMSSLFSLYEKLHEIRDRPSLALYFNKLDERYKKMRVRSISWVLYNYGLIMLWKRDSWLELLVHDAQIYARACKREKPQSFTQNLPNTEYEILEYL